MVVQITGGKPYSGDSEVETTGFLENMKSSFLHSWGENTSISRVVRDIGGFSKFKERDYTISQKLGFQEQSLPVKYHPQFRERLVEALGEDEFNSLIKEDQYLLTGKYTDYLAKRFPEEIKSDTNIYAELNNELKDTRDKYNQINSKASIGGSIGGFIGSTGALIADPINLATLLVPNPFAWGYRGASFLANTLTNVAYQSGLAIASEAAIQPFVYSFKNEIGVDYRLDESIGNVLLAGVGAAGIAGLGGIGVAGYRKFLNAFDKNVSDGVVKMTPDLNTMRGQVEELLDIAKSKPDGIPEDVFIQEYGEALHNLALNDTKVPELSADNIEAIARFEELKGKYFSEEDFKPKGIVDKVLGTGLKINKDLDQYDFIKNKQDSLSNINKQFREIENKSAGDIQQSDAKFTVELSERRRKLEVDLKATSKAYDNIKSHPDGLTAGLASLLSHDLKGKANYLSLEQRINAIKGEWHAYAADFLDKFRTRFFGLKQDTEGLREILKALYGESTKSEYKSLAKELDTLNNKILERFNKAGGNINKLDTWRIRQNHDASLVQKAGFDVWSRFVRDKTSITDEAVLKEIFDTIRTGGLTKVNPGIRSRNTGLSSRYSSERILHFKDADSWLAYNERFGRGDVYSNITSHIDSMARDTVLMEVFGTNPDSTFRFLKDLVEVDGTGPLNRDFLQGVFDDLSGKIDPDMSNMLASFAQGTRNIIYSAKLGKALITSFSDLSTAVMTSRFNGMEATKVMKRLFTNLRPYNTEDRLFAVRLGLTADNWIRSTTRYGDLVEAGITDKFAEFTMRAGGLDIWTKQARNAFGMEMSAFMAANRKLDYTSLKSEVVNLLQRYNITESDWSNIKLTKPTLYKNVEFLSPLDLKDKELTAKFLSMFQTEMDYAVPTPNARTRYFTTLGSKRGTVIGEAVRGGLMFKSFPITVLIMHMSRALNLNTKGSVGYITGLAIGGSILGALSLQTKNIVGGKTPEKMDDWSFWSRAMVEGEGWGLASDFIFNDHKQFNIKGLNPPTLDLATRLYDTAKDAIALNKNTGKDVEGLLRNYTPAGNLWYLRLAYERLILDHLKRAVDPRARSNFRRTITNARKQGQQFWWKPGR